jgi:tetratricopeptide (TPR) repeat protein
MVRSVAGARIVGRHAWQNRLFLLLFIAVAVVSGSPVRADDTDHLQRCHQAYEAGAYDVARGFCARAARDQSQPAESRALAHLYRALSSCLCAEALPDYDAAVALAPELAAVHIFRGRAYYELGRYDEALRDLMTAAKLDPREPSVYVWRGLVLESLDRPAEALSDFERLTAMTPKSSEGWRLKGNVEARLGRLDRASSDLDRSLKLNPRNDQALGVRAGVRAEMGDLKGARADADAAVRHGPNLPDYKLDRGRIALLAGDANGAIPDLIQGVLGLPEGARRQYAAIWLSMAILRTGRELEFMPTVLGVVDHSDKAAWPTSMAWLYLTALSRARKQWDMGDGAEHNEASHRAAALPNAHPREDRVCEFGFFMGMYHVLHKEPAHGEGLLRQAAERRAYSWCHIGAKIEHVRLLQRRAQGAVR